tara:strand:+ start:464 stop:742 length:279 start_codon:yes stop_codon:yes gene_type:complete
MTVDQYLQFQFVLLEIVMREKNKKHSSYLKMYEKLKFSKKKNKLQLGKYLLTRLLRESNRILVTAQKYSTDNCPKKETFKEDISFSNSATFH